MIRFVRLGAGIYAAVPKAMPRDPSAAPPDLALVSDAWSHLPTGAKRKVLQIVQTALTGQTNQVVDPVIASVLPDGPKAFPKDFLNEYVGSTRTVEVPNEELSVRRLAGGSYVVESHFGFRLDVRNETEGMFIGWAHARGARAIEVPDEMIHLFKAVKSYEGYLRRLWRDLYRAYGRQYGDRGAAYTHAKTAFNTLGLLVPDEARPSATTHAHEPPEKGRKLKRGVRTPETAFYLPILQALEELGRSGRTADVVRRVGEIMAGTLRADDRKPLPSTGLPRWENTTHFARHFMVRNGLLKSDSPHGVWENSSKGLEHLQRSRPD